MAGPYASVNCTLTLLSSSVRTSPSLDGGYDRAAADDSRFSDYYGGVQSIVTSSARNDSGLFDGPGDDRYLRYTARDGGLALRSAATAAVQARIAAASAVGPARLLDVRHGFPTEWARFVTSVPSGQPSPVPPAPAPLTLTLREEHYPYWASLAAGRVLDSVELFASAGSGDVTVSGDPPGTRPDTALRPDPSLGGLRRGLLAAPLPPALGELTLYLSDPALTDLWIVLTWGTAAAQ